MQFVIVARDGTDPEALERRMAACPAHIALGDEAVKRGEQLMGAALLDKEGQMCGSVLIVEFENREKLDDWLKREPYVTGKVWQSIEVLPCQLGPSFVHRTQ